ncbi:MAG: hypothetical protein V7760_05980, partial [Marinobacter sp.]
MLNDHSVNDSTVGSALPPPLVAECDSSSAHSEANPCKDSKYATIIYVTGHRSFWLIPQNVLDKIETSAGRLKAATTRETLEQRLEELKKAGLTDLFLPARAQSFLFPAEREEWQQLICNNLADEGEIKRLNKELERVKRSHLKKMVTWSPDTAGKNGPRLPPMLDLYGDQKPFITPQNKRLDSVEIRRKRLLTLREQGLATAKKAGYEIVNGQLFSPEQKGIKKSLTDYQQARRQFETDELANETRTAIFINTIRHNHTLMAYELARDKPDMAQVEQYLVELESLQDKMREYALAILDLANIGIATPEYALASRRQSTSDGIVQLANFQKLHWRIGSLADDMKNEGHSWFSALGGNGPVPATVLLKYQTDIQNLQAQQQELRDTAQKNANALLPPKMFVWEPDDYQITPQQTLARPGIPLREFSMPCGGSTLKHFSLLDLNGGRKLLGEAEKLHSADDIAISIKAAQKPGEDKALEKLLLDSGAQRFPLKDHWFDKKGLFKPETFCNTIETAGVLIERSAEELLDWGTQLRSFLFEAEAERHLLSFDDSYTGQFTRLVISGIPGELGKTLENNLTINILTGIDGPDNAPSFGVRSSQATAGYTFGHTSIGADLVYRQGQLDLISLTFPKPEEAKPVTISYVTESGGGELELGHFSCELNVKCWGYVGARILLSRSIGVEASPEAGIQITGIDYKNREATGAEFDAFAGAQTGLMAHAEMKWAIPDRLRKSRKWKLIGEDVPEWISLGTMSADLIGSGGAGAQGDIGIGLKNGRLIFYAKHHVVAGLGGGYSIGFELAFNAIPLWIQLLQMELHDNGYRRVYWIDDDAFKYLGMLTNLFLSSALNISFLAAQTYDFVEEIYRDFNSGKNAGIVAVRITEAIDIAEGRIMPTNDIARVTLNEYRSWFLGLQPEAIGPMLHNLVSEPVAFEAGDERERRSPEEILKLQQIS